MSRDILEAAGDDALQKNFAVYIYIYSECSATSQGSFSLYMGTLEICVANGFSSILRVDRRAWRPLFSDEEVYCCVYYVHACARGCCNFNDYFPKLITGCWIPLYWISQLYYTIYIEYCYRIIPLYCLHWFLWILFHMLRVYYIIYRAWMNLRTKRSPLPN